MEKIKNLLTGLLKNKYFYVFSVMLVFSFAEPLKDAYKSYGDAVFAFLTVITAMFFFRFRVQKEG